MKREIEIGTTGDGRTVRMDVSVMLRSGLLVQANSGGGKSWFLRRLAEQLCPLVPTFVVDVEGEFASLREKFPFFLVARHGGDAVADPRSAGAIARKLLELRVSAVFDLFELDIQDRHAWMRGFLHGIDQAPRDLWGDTAIIIDEAHVFAPEKGKGESVALAGMSALASRGRKRGFGPADATQRMGKFNKDVAAELKNAAIGWTWMDIDRDRAIETLGVGRKEREAFDKQLRAMEPGEFFLVGRAFGTFEPLRVKVGPVQSTHPEPGATKQLAAPPPPAKIRAILAKLGDLPKDDEESPGTETELRRRVADLERQLSSRPAAPPPPPERIEVPVFPREMLLRLVEATRAAGEVRDAAARLADRLNNLTTEGRDLANRPGAAVRVPPAWTPPADMAERMSQGRSWKPGPPSQPAGSNGKSSDAGPTRMLRALAARHPTPLTEQQVAVLAGMSRKGGTYRTYRAQLSGRGLIVKDGSFLRITGAGLQEAGPVTQPTSAAELVAVWRERFTGKARDLLEYLAAQGERAVSKAEALTQIGLDPSGGTARTYWGQLSGCGLIEKAPGGFRAVQSLRL